MVCMAMPRSAQTCGQALEVGGVLRVLHHHVVVGEQDGVEGEALEAAEVHGGDGDAVAGDADVAGEALVARLDGVLEGAAGSEGGLPLGLVDEVVELEEVDVVGLQAFEGVLELRLRFVARCARRSWWRGRSGRGARGIQAPTRRSERP